MSCSNVFVAVAVFYHKLEFSIRKLFKALCVSLYFQKYFYEFRKN